MDAYGFSYVECDIPEGVTLDQWPRRHATHRAPRPRFARLRRSLRR